MTKVAAALLTSAILLTSSQAGAYLCTRVVDEAGNETGPSISWMSRQISFALHKDGTATIDGTEEFDEIRAAFQVWEDISRGWDGTGCAPPIEHTDLVFKEASALSDIDRVGYDYLNPANNENLMVFRDDGWPHPNMTGMIIGLTTTTYNSLTGEIFDADIEFNAAQFPFTIVDNNVQTDLMNTTVHEIGHFLGLGHTADAEATMYGSAATGEIKKRDLGCDDALAVALKYPAGQPNGYCPGAAAAPCGFCEPPKPLTNSVKIKITDSIDGQDSGGCQQLEGISAVAGIALLLMLARRRRGQHS